MLKVHLETPSKHVSDPIPISQDIIYARYTYDVC